MTAGARVGSKGWRYSVGDWFFWWILGGGFKPTTDHCFRGAPTGHGIPAQGETLGSTIQTFWRSEGTLHNPGSPAGRRAMRRSFRTRPILNAESQGFTLGWYAVPRRGTGMSMVCGALLGHGRGMYAVCRDWTGQAKIFQGRFLLDETAKIEWLGMDGGVGCQPDSSSGRGTQEQ